MRPSTAPGAGELRLDLVVGRVVRDVDGATVGRLADVVARREDGALVVATYIVGPHAWIHRFAIHGLGWRLWGLAWFYRVNWDQMNLSDTYHPRLTCRRDELTIDHMPPRKRTVTRRPGRRLA
jgi:hypothetical protein